MNRRLFVVALAFLISTSAVAQTAPCPCYPKTVTWVAMPCSTWTEASSALVLAAGRPDVLALPTGDPEHPWVVLRRVVSGSAATSPDNPFTVETFDNVTLASSRFASITTEQRPILITVPDGQTLVISIRSDEGTKRRAAGR